MKKQSLLLPVCLVLAFHSFAQRTVAPSDTVVIAGKIKTELRFALHDLQHMPVQSIPNVQLTSHEGVAKGIVKELKGFPLKVLLDKIEWVNAKPKELNSYYLTFKATDGYTVVFSWNELFNTPIGNNLFVITEKDGKKLPDMSERILVVSTSDLQIGRRYIKGLSQIQVSQAL